jgi:ABC-type multidrug transport system permease subunit
MVSSVNNASVLDIAIYDLGNSQLVTAMQQLPDLTLHMVDSEAALQAKITDGDMSGLQIPATFDADVAAGKVPDLTIWLNPANGLASETAEWQRFIESEIHKLGRQSLPAQIEWVSVENSSFTADTVLDSFLLIIVLTMVLFITGTNLVALLITEEKEKKMGIVLMNSPAHPYHIGLGKALAGTICISLVMALVILLNGGLTGNWPLALLYLAISLPVSLGISILTGSLVYSSRQCNSLLGVGLLVFLIPAWFSTMLELPEPFGTIFSVLPTNFLVQGLNGALNHTETVAANNVNFTIWFAFMVVTVAAAVWRVYQNPKSIVDQS